MSRRMSLPLGSIVRVSPLNPRAHDESSVVSLAATLRAVGLKHPLLVRAIDSESVTSEFEVLAGQRRLRALQALASTGEGALIGAIDLDAIDVDIFAGTDAEALEAILAIEGEVAPLHPVDLYETFARLGEHQGYDEARIARDFGLSARDVGRTLALGRMAPEVRSAWREKKISREAAEAFASGRSAEAQAAVLAEALQPHGAYLLSYPANIRQRLRGDVLTGAAAEAIYVGRAAYEAAGGICEADLWSTDEQVLFLDGTLLKRLADEKMTREGEAIAAAEGWGIVTLDDEDFDNPAYDRELDFSDEEQKRLEEISTERRDASADVRRELNDEEDQIVARAELRTYAAAARGNMAILCELDTVGRLSITRGLTRIPDENAHQGDNADDQDDGRDGDGEDITVPRPGDDDEEDEPTAPRTAWPALSNGERQVIDATLARAIPQIARVEIGRALVLAVAACASGMHNGSGVMMNGRAPGETENPVLLAIDAADSFAQALDACAGASLADLTTAFAEIVAASFDPLNKRVEDMTPVCDALFRRGGDVIGAFKESFDAVGWFEAANKAGAVAAIREMQGDAVAAGKAKKHVAAATAAKLARDKGWLPPTLRLMAGETIEPAAPDQSLAEAMHDAIEKDEAETAELAQRVGRWLEAKFNIPDVPEKRIEKINTLHLRFCAEEEAMPDMADFSQALIARGFDIREWRGKDWLFTASTEQGEDTGGDQVDAHSEAAE